MKKAPVVLVSSGSDARGNEFGDMSISLSERYFNALLHAGALPLVLPPTEDKTVLAELVRRADGVMLSGGDDVLPGIYTDDPPASLVSKVGPCPDGGRRDLRELLLVQEVFRQRKPLLAICRGHQVLNVALGGTLFLDIPSQVRTTTNHRQMDRRCEVVHEVALTPGSLLAKITGKQKLGVNSTHHQAVAQVAPCLEVTGVSNDGVVETLELKPGDDWLPFLLGIQFHPERLADRYPEHRAIFQSFTRACASCHKLKYEGQSSNSR